MRIAVLSDPNNFHTQKWVRALAKAGAEVIVMSYDAYEQQEIPAIRLSPPIGRNGRYSYLDYLHGGKVLRKAIEHHGIDVLNPINVTPFGVWAMRSGFHPVAACAVGADILEYPPSGEHSPADRGRSWEMLTTKPSPLLRLANRWKRRYYRRKVARALAHADLVTGDNQCLVDCMADWFGIPVQKLELLHWGVEPELFQASESQLEEIRQSLGILPGQKVVMSPRGAKPVYQADIILRAFAEVLATGRKDAFFLFLGAGYPVSPEIGTAAESLSESYPNFKFIPHGLPREQIHALWNLVDIFVSAPVYDGYSAALAEGRYVGAIPLVNDIPAHREFITHLSNGWICKPFDAPTLASDLAHLIENSGIYRQKFAPVNRKWIMAYSIMETNALRFLELLGNRFPSLRTGRRDG